jgi:hypothetical protein
VPDMENEPNDRTSPNNRTCQAKTKAGFRCRAPAVSGKQYCSLHSDPTRAVKLGRKGGAKNRHRCPPFSEPVSVPSTAADVKKLLAEAIGQLRAGRLDPKIATSLAYVSGPLIKAIETAELELRVQTLERELFDETNEED